MTVPAQNGSGRSDHLEFIRRAGQTTRRAIAEHTGLSRSVVAQAVSELIAQGLVVERRLVQGALRSAHGAQRGRPTAVLELAGQSGVVVAADIGHRHLTVAVCDLKGRVLEETRIPFPVDDSARATFRELHRLVAASLTRAGVGATDVAGFGVSFPFPVTKPTGMVLAPVALLGWQNVSAAEARPPGLPGPIVHDNDANFGAWGERIHGGSPELDNLLYVKLGHGIGSGVIVDGMLLSGARGTSGEMGHIQVDPHGEVCRCGRRGCLETVVAASLPDRRLAGLRVGRAIAQLSAFVDAEVVILGGRFGASDGALMEGVKDAFARFTPDNEDPSGEGAGGAADGSPRVRIQAAALGERSELVGIIDRTLSAAWASGAGRSATRRTGAHSSWDRTNSEVVLEVPFDAERFVMKE